MMDIPTWGDLLPWARSVTTESMSAGGGPGAAVALFEDGQASLLGRPSHRLDDVGSATRELVAMLGMFGAEAMAVVQPLRLRKPGDHGPLGDARASMGVLLSTGMRGDGVMITTAEVLPFTVNDAGLPDWDQVVTIDDGPLDDLLAAAMQDGPPSGEPLAGIAYAADRFGHGLAVAPTAEDHYGLREPLSPTMVRREDRRRVRELAGLHATVRA